MAWLLESGSCDGTEDMLALLADFLTANAPNFTVIRAGETPAAASSNLQLNYPSYFRWVSSAGVFQYNRQSIFTFGYGGVEIWLIADRAYNGSPVAGHNHPNVGIFGYLTATLGVGVNGFKAMQTDGDSGADPQASPQFSSVYPAYGAFEYHFRTDGDRVHVSFIRDTSGGQAWQHFSFGGIEKGDSWVGGEYFSGCCYGEDSRVYAGSGSKCWDQTLSTGDYGGYNNHLLSSCQSGQRINPGQGYSFADPYGKGMVRVVGAKTCLTPFPATVWCILGDTVSGVVGGGVATDRVGSVGVLNAMSAGQAITGTTETSPTLPTRCLLELSANDWDNRSVGLAPDLFYYDYEVSLQWHYLGSVPGIRFVNSEFLSPGEVVNNDWHVFPVSTPNPPNLVAGENGFACSGDFGIAFKFQN